MVTMKRTLAVVMMAVMMMGLTEGGPVLQNETDTATSMPLLTTTATTSTPQNDTICPPLLFVARDSVCVLVNDVVKAKVITRLRKRSAAIPGQTCPFCANGVYDAYPDWNNCGWFNYCLDGAIIRFKCADVGGLFFNPALKACELFDNSNNMCLHRSVSLLTIDS